jgi:hypothetical protein
MSESGLTNSILAATVAAMGISCLDPRDLAVRPTADTLRPAVQARPQPCTSAVTGVWFVIGMSLCPEAEH